MGKPGPKQKPKVLDDLDGNPSNRAKADPVKALGEPVPPSWLGEYGLEIWAQVVSSMPPNFYASADALILASYCQACSMVKNGAEQVESEGITITNKQGNKVRHPAVAIMSDGMSKIVTIGNNLGLDPSARQSMGVSVGANPADKKPTSKFSGLTGINGGKC